MPQSRSNKGQTPVNSDSYDLTGHLATMADSLEVVVPVADRTEGDAVATARAAAGWAVTDARPLFVWNQTTDTIEVKDSSGWRGIGMYHRHQEFIATAFAVAGGSVQWDAGPLVNQAGAALNTGIATQGPLSGQITINNTGWYAFSSLSMPDGNPGNCWMEVRKNNGTEVVAAGNTTGYAWPIWMSNPKILLAAGDTLRWTVMQVTARSTTTKVRIDKLDG
jgi:hypothetical protein